MSLLDALAGNLLSPMVLFFLLGGLAAALRSDLVIPDGLAKGLSIYLMIAIGFKGGVAMAAGGIGFKLVATLLFGALLSFSLPFLAERLLNRFTRVRMADAASIAAHYGSISIVTFLTAAEFLRSQDIASEGYMVATAAVMEFPAILAGLWLAGRALRAGGGEALPTGALLREVLVNGSVVLLIGSFAIGWITGDAGMTAVKPFLLDPFKGVLCIFLLDMGMVAAKRLGESKELDYRLALFAIYMPLLSAVLGIAGGWILGLSVGGVTLMAVLAASASYIAVPAAMRLALPQANPALSLACSLAITFPFNVVLGIPLYLSAAQGLVGP